MAKRFFDTDFYKNPFIRSLEGAYKALYSFIITDADHCGIWFPDFQAATMYIDLKVTEPGAKKAFHGKFIELPSGKWFFPDLIKQQQPKGLSSTNLAHSKIIEKLGKYGLLNEDYSIKNIEGLSSPFQGAKVKVMVKEEVKVKDKEARREKFIHWVNSVNDQFNILDNQLLNHIADGFISYWAESGLNDNKMRFEKEKSFDVNRRLHTWLRNKKKYDKGNTKTGGWDGVVNSPS